MAQPPGEPLEAVHERLQTDRERIVLLGRRARMVRIAREPRQPARGLLDQRPSPLEPARAPFGEHLVTVPAGDMADQLDEIDALLKGEGS